MNVNGEGHGFDPAETSVHVQRAHGGDVESVAWIVSRFSPLLRVQASYRVRGPLRRLYDPDDIVEEVWVRSLPRIPSLTPRDGRLTPVLLQYLGTTLLRLVNELLRKHVRGKPTLLEGGSGLSHPIHRLPADVSQASARAQRDEAVVAIERALAGVSDKAREIFVLRGIEQLSNREAAERLGESEKTVSMRWSRVLGELREALPRSLFDDLDDR